MLDFRFLPKNIKPKNDFSGRRRFLLIAMMSVMGLLTCRAVFLQIFNTEFYQHKGETFQINNVEIPAYRGTIKDRNGVTLAGSMPVSTIVADAKVLGEDDERRLDELKKRLQKRP
ncbi:hypothetical protein [Methylocucumis oryzae]|uniref:beta-lactamase n=1 Tax=Methylocucumis oryzae TaxID=1632867 RepID=A0A0F3IGK6_9GAMM|nr:hypothetical protein [Methylocucumis oryzae]KJV05663.1 hypothetical protein VZ94_16470 [Methylocucumis oryzae]